MHEREDDGVRAVAPQRGEALAVVAHVLRDVARGDVEDVDEDADVLEDRRLLGGQVRVHEGVLAAAVPEVEDEVAEEADVVLLDVDRCTQARCERGGVIRAAWSGEINEIVRGMIRCAGVMLTR